MPSIKSKFEEYVNSLLKPSFPPRLSLSRNPDGDHRGREYCDIYLDATLVGGLFCTAEQREHVARAFALFNQPATPAQLKEG